MIRQRRKILSLLRQFDRCVVLADENDRVVVVILADLLTRARVQYLGCESVGEAPCALAFYRSQDSSNQKFNIQNGK